MKIREQNEDVADCCHLSDGVEECWATVDGYRMRYLRRGPEGTDRATLLIHGLLGYSFSWRYNMEALSSLKTVYAIDLLGVGFSDRPSDLDCSLRATAKRLLAIMDQLGIKQADVVGTSHGGGVAILLAAMAPERVRRLVLVAAINPWSNHGKLLTRMIALLPGSVHAGMFQMIRKTGRVWLERMYGDPQRIKPGTIEGYARPAAIPGTATYLLNVMRCWHSGLRELESALPGISAPTLLVWGSHDRVVFPNSALQLQNRLRGAELIMLDGLGHLPYEESPDEFNRAIVGWLQSEV
jgi:pimeloyl-ACP methyl ester carboxylesterase